MTLKQGVIMENPIQTPSEFVLKSRLPNNHSQINGNELKLHTFGHEKDSFEDNTKIGGQNGKV